jgi:outer membrane protein OmpA-like peptidoglycan-associated protein/tetratricopeptide (TPR) repeat protein
MKKIISILTLVLLSGFVATAQSNATKKADRHFNKFQFVDAAKEYLKLANSSSADLYVFTRLADSYYNIFNTIEAEKWYVKALGLSDDPELIYKYSQMLKANGKYQQSNVEMSKFASRRPADNRSIAFNKNPDYLQKILKKGKKFNIQNLALNSEQADFGGMTKNGVFYFTSGRNSKRKTYGWNEEPFLDIYSVNINSDGSFQEPVIMNENINTRFHEGLVAFSKDGNSMYFTRESYYDRSSEKDSITKYQISHINLYKSEKEEGGWSLADALNLNGTNYSVKNPSVSSDGKTLYFASDMVGGYGKFDIYKAEINEDGTLGEPVNMGQKVNTEGQEMFPYISNKDVLYFSSDGHLGLGGLDVFFTRTIDGKQTPVRNVGVPVNGNADDFAFIFDEDTEKGFISSNREGGKGSDDIYAIKKLESLCDVLITSVIVDSETATPLSGASVSLVDEQGNTLLTKQSSEEGIVNFMVECETKLKLFVSSSDYESSSEDIPATSEEEINVEVALQPIDEIILANRIVLNPIYFEYDRSNITAKAAFELDKVVQVMSKYTSIVLNIESHTDNRGSDSYNQKLSERRAVTSAQYIISKGIDASRVSGVGKGESTPVIDCGDDCTDKDYQLNRRSEFYILSGSPKEDN